MRLAEFITQLQMLDGEIEVKFGLSNDHYTDPMIIPTEDTDTLEYYYRIVGV